MNKQTPKNHSPESELWSTLLTVADKPVYIEVGDLCLSIRKSVHEWQLNYHWEKKGNDGGYSCSYIDSFSAEPETIDRIAMESMSDGFSLIPKLADRPVVVRPYSPFTLPANNTITLYVSTPIWLNVIFAEGVTKELAVQELSETWMGGLTGNGELCYGSHTHARLDKDLLQHLPFRALTPTTIHNKGDSDLTLERLSIPTPYLSIHTNDKHQLITESLSITMDSSSHSGIVKIEPSSKDSRISTPRLTTDRGVLVSAWENLFA